MEEFVLKWSQMKDDESLLDEMMSLYGQDILQLVYSYVKDAVVAEDLTQEIFIKCYKALPTYNQQSNIRTWLWRIAINHCKDYRKSWYFRKVSTAEEEQDWTSTDNVEEEVIQQDEDRQLAVAVMELPIQYRELIYLHYFQEMKLKEISEITGVKLGTVKTRMRQAKRRLKTYWEESTDGR
ncbi:sigma-70 family RNA polymerase sigma factor [Peribacillus castrilensis]|uniref:sigma-70 family RNA polymerase sigma factor n=1 Tax=Peribacillus TaxID=2675229 RepID=UPI0006AC4B2E|nr:RNA polymerase factor sigma C [Peribacillus frigoritolerans]KOR80506.1 RNA polymerase factor sigma C [Bacillus sp. FJAT-21352]KOR85814.1 RNA polymerase factor sigma C [Bacillus sp. FJAT-22058]MBD8591691.1 sigma-70 family RNA polymerase sigma factor [Peribacillus simplex]NCT36575.1 sigma-70 family RNA polymerase sigma factor [Peribacillus frigoritolerans]